MAVLNHAITIRYGRMPPSRWPSIVQTVMETERALQLRATSIRMHLVYACYKYRVPASSSLHRTVADKKTHRRIQYALVILCEYMQTDKWKANNTTWTMLYHLILYIFISNRMEM